MVQAWIVRLDAMKDEAFEGRLPQTAESVAHLSQIHTGFQEARAAGLPIDRASFVGVAKAGGMPIRCAQLRTRGWYLTLSLHQHGGDYWGWQLGASGHGSQIDLRRAVERLGGDYEKPALIPEHSGGHVTHWAWRHVGPA